MVRRCSVRQGEGSINDCDSVRLGPAGQGQPRYCAVRYGLGSIRFDCSVVRCGGARLGTARRGEAREVSTIFAGLQLGSAWQCSVGQATAGSGEADKGWAREVSEDQPWHGEVRLGADGYSRDWHSVIRRGMARHGNAGHGEGSITQEIELQRGVATHCLVGQCMTL